MVGIETLIAVECSQLTAMVFLLLIVVLALVMLVSFSRSSRKAMPTTDSVPKVHVQRQSTTAQMIRFTNRVQKERESATEYARVIEELLDTLFPALEATTREVTLQDRFVNGLRDGEIRMEVKRTIAIMKCINKSVTLQGLVHMAERFPMVSTRHNSYSSPQHTNKQ